MCYEALAAGLPVVTTPNAGSVVRDGVEGFIVPAGDVEAFTERIHQLVRDRDLRRWMADNARRRADRCDRRNIPRAAIGRSVIDPLARAADDVRCQGCFDRHQRRRLGSLQSAAFAQARRMTVAPW